MLPMGFTTAREHAIEREQTIFIGTGAKELDTLLQGAWACFAEHVAPLGRPILRRARSPSPRPPRPPLRVRTH